MRAIKDEQDIALRRYVDKRIHETLIYEKSEDYKALSTKIRQEYFDKSANQFDFFVKNVSHKRNKLTDEYLVDYTKESCYISVAKNLTLNQRAYEINGKTKKHFVNEIIQGGFLEEADAKYGHKKLAKVYYLEQLNEGKQSYFITWSLPSEYHMYKRKTGLEEADIDYGDMNALSKNPKYMGGSFEDAIELGMLKMNEIHTYFYHSLEMRVRNIIRTQYRSKTKETLNRIQKSRTLDRDTSKRLRGSLQQHYKRAIKKEHMDFIKALEPHKNGQVHAHLLIWLDTAYQSQLFAAYNDTIKHFSLVKRRQKLEIINSELAKPSSYVAKYITKENTAENLFYNQYKRKFGKKHRFFTTSNFRHTTQRKIDIMYRYFAKERPSFLTRIKEKGRSLYHWLERLEVIGVFCFIEKKEERVVLDTQKLNSHPYANYRNEVDRLQSEYEQKVQDDIILYDLNMDSKENQRIIDDDLKKNYEQIIQKVHREFQAICLAQKEKYLKNIKINVIKRAYINLSFQADKSETYELIYEEGMYDENRLSDYSVFEKYERINPINVDYSLYDGHPYYDNRLSSK